MSGKHHRGFHLYEYIWSVTCLYPEINQIQQLRTITQVRTWKQNSNSKQHQRKKTHNKHCACTALICNFHYYLSQYGNATYRPIYAGTLKSISNLTVKSRRKIILKTYLQAVFFFICHLKWMQVLFLMMDITAYYSDILEHFNSAGIIFVLKRKIANSCRHFSPQKRLFLSILWSKYTKNLCFQM